MHLPSSLLATLAFVAACACLAVAWVSLALVAHDLVRRRRSLSVPDTVLALAFFLAALALRTLLPTPTLIHEDHHGYAFDPALPLTRDVTFNQVLSTRILLYKLVSYLFPFSTSTLFTHSVLLASLGVAGLFLLVRAVHPVRAVAVCSASVLLVQPLAVLMAATEEPLVLACGGGLVALALLAWGTRAKLASALVAGSALFAFSACARELTLLLSPLVPLVVLASLPDRTAPTIRRAISTVFLTALALVPYALHVRDVARSTAVTRTLVSLPHLPFTLHGRDLAWLGWRAPYIPAYLPWLALAGLAGCLVVVFAVRRERRFALLALGTVTVCTLEGGLVSTGYFPSALRHQLFATASLALPVGWLAGTVVDRLASRTSQRTAVTIAGCTMWLALGLFALVHTPAGYRIETPLTQEYAFFARTLAALPAQARVVVFTRDQSHSVDHLAPGFLHAQRPAWGLVTSPDLAQLHDDPDPRPVVLLLDRTCFLARACLNTRTPDGCRDESRPEVREMQPSPYGRMAPYCREALRALPFREVARTHVVTLPLPYDMPAVDDAVDLAALVWTR